MKVVSVNVGLPRIVEYLGEPLATGIFKSPVDGPVAVGRLNLGGDGQADLRVHGGQKKAVYVYPSEHYEFWRRELPDLELSWGVFGENLTTQGLTEKDVRTRDLFKIGSAEFAVTIPRYPCFKLGIRFSHLEAESRRMSPGESDIIRRFVKAGRSGFYLEVRRTGSLSAGDEIELLSSGDGPAIDDVYRERLKL